jgi:hypothetical protein
MNAPPIFTLLRAQVAAEVKTRWRSTPTAVAVIAILVASFKWIPDPASGAVSLAWTDPAGQETSGIYNSAYLGASVSVLASLFLSLIGFYLVAGSIRRDRSNGVGAILAATPLPSWTYLAGKIAAHSVYLWTIGLASLAGGLLVFLRFGQGPFEPLAFITPWLLFVAPGMVFVAALAVLFDATPGLRGAGGYVLYFFVWIFVLVVVPGLTSGGMGADGAPQVASTPYYDPIGMGAILQMLQESTGSRLGDVSIGLQYGIDDMVQIEWSGLEYSLRWVGLRFWTFVWTLLPFGLALLFFDRFDPSRKRAGRQPAARPAAAVATGGEPAGRIVSLSALPPVHCAPGFWRSVLAEARILWSGAGLLRFVLPLAALAAAVPGKAGLPGAAALLLLRAPALAELAARETLAGTWPLILGQPGVPASTVWWKLCSALVFTFALGLPRFLASLAEPSLALAWLCGLFFVAAFAVAAGALTGGGKLFTGFYVAIWYTALNAAPFADFAGAMSPAPALATSAIYAGVGLATIALAWGVERRRFSFA